MLSDLSALLPPLLVCIAFLVAVWAFLKHEMGPRGSGSGDEPDESGGPENPGAESGRTGDDDSFEPDPKSDSAETRQRSDG